MLNEKFLLDDFHMSGVKEDEFERVLNAIDARTSHILRSSSSLVVLSSKERDCQTDPKSIKAWYLPPQNPILKGVVQSCNIPAIKNISSLTDEILSDNKTLFYDTEGNTVYSVSSIAYNTLAQRINVKGESIKEQSLERDLFISKKLGVPNGITLVVKHFNQVGKVFAMMSDTYPAIPLQELCFITNELDEKKKLGQKVCEGWDISHKLVRISFSFPQYAETINRPYQFKHPLMPCIELSTSDTGNSSFWVRSYWKTTKGAIVYDRSVSRQHKGNFDTTKFAKLIDESIFAHYGRLPARLAELQAIKIKPDANLESSRGCTRNHHAVLGIYKYCFKTLGLVEIIGKKKLLLIENEIDWNYIKNNQSYTVYDIVMNIFSLSETLTDFFDTYKVGKETRRKFREAISKAAFLDFEHFIKQDKAENSQKKIS